MFRSSFDELEEGQRKENKMAEAETSTFRLPPKFYLRFRVGVLT
jgi:hypothetical protein